MHLLVIVLLTTVFFSVGGRRVEVGIFSGACRRLSFLFVKFSLSLPLRISPPLSLSLCGLPVFGMFCSMVLVLVTHFC